MNTYADLQEIEDKFDQEEQLDSMRYEIMDSNLLETIKYNQSPEQVIRKSNNINKNTRGSFGCQMMPQKQSNNNSIQTSLQYETGIQSTAQFPQGKKFHQRFTNISDEQEISKTRLSKKSNLIIDTDQESEEEQQRITTQEEMEYFLMTLIQEVKKQQQEIERLQGISDRQKLANNNSLQTNKELCDVLDQTQQQMMVLAQANQLLKKKYLSYETTDRISTFLTAESVGEHQKFHKRH